MSLMAKGAVCLWLQNDEIYFVKKMDAEWKMGDMISKITFHAERLTDKKKFRFTAKVDSNLLHDLADFCNVSTEDVFIIRQTRENEVTWRVYPEEEWKPFLEKLKEKKE